MGIDKTYLHKTGNEYFDYKGQRYYAGTRFTMKKRNSYDQWRTVEATFHGYDHNGNTDQLCMCYKDMNVKSIAGADYYFYVTRDEIDNLIIDITHSNYCAVAYTRKYVSDSNIIELIVGWPLYIFLMVGATIFNDRVSGWVLITIIFFLWRNKIKENYYYE